MAQSVVHVPIIGIMFTPWGAWIKVWPLCGHGVKRKGLEGCGAATAFGHKWPNVGAGARKRGVPQSLVFCGAKNAPKFGARGSISMAYKVNGYYTRPT
jgi:hypothetical protein